MFLFLVADVEVKEDGVFIRLRKETVVPEDNDLSNRVPSGVSSEPVVEKIPECSGSEVVVWIPIRNCLYQKFIYVSILKPRR